MKRRPRTPQRGIALFTVIAILAICMIVLGAMLRGLVDEHRQSRLRHEHRQCRWLADAGAERGALIRASNESFTGESWSVDADDLAMPRDAMVTIAVDGNNIAATAIYPATENPRVRHTVRHDLQPTTATPIAEDDK